MSYELLNVSFTLVAFANILYLIIAINGKNYEAQLWSVFVSFVLIMSSVFLNNLLLAFMGSLAIALMFIYYGFKQ